MTAGAGNKPWSGKSVVIVDDSLTVRESLRRVYESIGMRVLGVADNGLVGLQLATNLQPDLVSLDVIMPEMDGIECYRKLRALRPEQRIVLISWLGGEQKIVDNFKDVVPAYLFQPKPVSAQELEARLDLVWNPDKAEAMTAKAGIRSTLEESAAMMDLNIKVS